MVARGYDTQFLVVALCAQWCGTCRGYRAGFEALAAQYPDSAFLWVDIEDEADWLGDLDVENFPSIVIQRDDEVLFFGTVLPDMKVLQRLLTRYLTHESPPQQNAHGANIRQLLRNKKGT